MFYKTAVILIFIIGILLRLKAYFMNVPLWLDECSLALNIMHRNIFGYFIPLEHIQSAPPFFMMATKLVTMVFGLSEYTLRLIPLLVSVVSIFVFYIFSKKIFDKKWSILAANLIFAINFRLIYFAEEFKQYASDVLFFMLALFFLSKVELGKVSFKKALFTGLVCFLMLLCSMPSMFVTGAYVVYNLKLLNKGTGGGRNLFGFLLPFFIFGPFYYIYNLYPTKQAMFSNFLDQWQSGFMNYNPLNIFPLLRENLDYLFNFTTFILFGVVLLVWGIILLSKSENKIVKLMLLALLLSFVASFCNIFPIKNRVSVYIIIPFLICIIKPLDIVSVKNKISGALAIIFALLFFSAYNLAYAKSLVFENFIKSKKDGRATMEILSKKFKPDEVLVYNDATNSIYDFYSEKSGMYADKIIRINLPQYSREFYLGLLNQLPKNHTYWFYYANDYVRMPVVPFIREWIQDKEVLEEHCINESYLLHVKL